MELSCLVTRPGLSARDRFGRRWPCGLAQGTRSCERAAGRGVRAERLPANYRQHPKGREGRLLHVTWYESPPRKQTAQRNPQTAGASALPLAPAGSGGRVHTLHDPCLCLFVCLFSVLEQLWRLRDALEKKCNLDNRRVQCSLQRSLGFEPLEYL